LAVIGPEHAVLVKCGITHIEKYTKFIWLQNTGCTVKSNSVIQKIQLCMPHASQGCTVDEYCSGCSGRHTNPQQTAHTTRAVTGLV